MTSGTTGRRGHWPLLLGVLAAAACDNDTSPETCSTSKSTMDVAGIWTIEGGGERAGCVDPGWNGAFTLGPSAKLPVVATRAPGPDAGPSPDGGIADGAIDGGMDGSSDSSPDSSPDSTDMATQTDGKTEADLAMDGLDGTMLDGLLDGLLDIEPVDARPDLRRPPKSNIYKLRLDGAPPSFSLEGEARGTCVTFETREETHNAGVLTYSFSGTASKKGSERKIRGTFKGTGPAGCTVAGEFEVQIR